MEPLRVALLQIDTTPGDLTGNAGRIISGAARAREMKADLVVTSELALMGYLPRDLLLSVDFVRHGRRPGGGGGGAPPPRRRERPSALQ
jgi:NAD+ synthase/NAD+ synthase (glutamine-hydrolysing)